MLHIIYLSYKAKSIKQYMLQKLSKASRRPYPSHIAVARQRSQPVIILIPIIVVWVSAIHSAILTIEAAIVVGMADTVHKAPITIV